MLSNGLTLNDEENLLNSNFTANIVQPTETSHHNPNDARDDVNERKDDRTSREWQGSIVRTTVAVLTTILNCLSTVLSSTLHSLEARFAAELAALSTAFGTAVSNVKHLF